MLTVVTPVTEEPISLDEVKDYLRQGGDGETEFTADDVLLGMLITAAREKAEASLRIFLAAATYDYTVQTCGVLVPLGRANIATISAVTVHSDEDGDVSIDSADYYKRLKKDPPEIELTNPTVDYYAVTVRFTTAAAAVPQMLKLAMLYLVAHYYENRELIITSGAVPQSTPEAYQRIIHIMRRHRL